MDTKCSLFFAFCVSFASAFAVSPVYVNLDDMPGNTPLMTNTVEYVDSVVIATGSVTPKIVTNITSEVVTSMVTRSYVEDYLGIQSSGQAITNAAMYAYGLSTNYTDSVVSNKQDKLSKNGDVFDIRVSELGSTSDVIYPSGKWIRHLLGGIVTNDLCTFEAVSSATNNMEKIGSEDQIVRGERIDVGVGRPGWRINTTFASNTVMIVPSSPVGGVTVSLESTNGVYRLRDSGGRWYAFIGEGGGGGGYWDATNKQDRLYYLSQTNAWIINPTVFNVKYTDPGGGEHESTATVIGEPIFSGDGRNLWGVGLNIDEFQPNDFYLMCNSPSNETSLVFSEIVSQVSQVTMVFGTGVSYVSAVKGTGFIRNYIGSEVDTEPIVGSTNLITSGGVAGGLAKKRDKDDLMTSWSFSGNTNGYDHLNVTVSYDHSQSTYRYVLSNGANGLSSVSSANPNETTVDFPTQEGHIGATRDWIAIKPDVYTAVTNATGGFTFKLESGSFNVYSNGTKVGSLQYTPVQ